MLEKIDKNPFTDMIINEIEKSLNKDDIFHSTYVQIFKERVQVYCNPDYYFANYNLPNLSLGGQLALAKCIKLRFNKKGYDCGVRPIKYTHVNRFSDTPDVPHIIGYEIPSFRKKEYINENVTGSW